MEAVEAGSHLRLTLRSIGSYLQYVSKISRLLQKKPYERTFIAIRSKSTGTLWRPVEAVEAGSHLELTLGSIGSYLG